TLRCDHHIPLSWRLRILACSTRGAIFWSSVWASWAFRVLLPGLPRLLLPRLLLVHLVLRPPFLHPITEYILAMATLQSGVLPGHPMASVSLRGLRMQRCRSGTR